MPFKIVSGEFVPEAGRPDGDSVRFRPDDPTPPPPFFSSLAEVVLPELARQHRRYNFGSRG